MRSYLLLGAVALVAASPNPAPQAFDPNKVAAIPVALAQGAPVGIGPAVDTGDYNQDHALAQVAAAAAGPTKAAAANKRSLDERTDYYGEQPQGYYQPPSYGKPSSSSHTTATPSKTPSQGYGHSPKTSLKSSSSSHATPSHVKTSAHGYVQPSSSSHATPSHTKTSAQEYGHPSKAPVKPSSSSHPSPSKTPSQGYGHPSKPAVKPSSSSHPTPSSKTPSEGYGHPSKTPVKPSSSNHAIPSSKTPSQGYSHPSKPLSSSHTPPAVKTSAQGYGHPSKAPVKPSSIGHAIPSSKVPSQGYGHPSAKPSSSSHAIASSKPVSQGYGHPSSSSHATPSHAKTSDQGYGYPSKASSSSHAVPSSKIPSEGYGHPSKAPVKPSSSHASPSPYGKPSSQIYNHPSKAPSKPSSSHATPSAYNKPSSQGYGHPSKAPIKSSSSSHLNHPFPSQTPSQGHGYGQSSKAPIKSSSSGHATPTSKIPSQGYSQSPKSPIKPSSQAYVHSSQAPVKPASQAYGHPSLAPVKPSSSSHAVPSPIKTPVSRPTVTPISSGSTYAVPSTCSMVSYTGTAVFTSDAACPTPYEVGTYCGHSNIVNPCAPQLRGYGPPTKPDTVDAFKNNQVYHQMAENAPTPSGYQQVFKDLNGAVSANSYLGFKQLTSYSVSECASYCDDTNLCTAFNIFIERDPEYNPSSCSCTNPPSMANYKCSLYGSDIQASAATNIGQMHEGFQIVIVASNGYEKGSTTPPTTPSGSTNPQDCGKKIHNHPRYSLGQTSIPGPFDVSLCAAYAAKQNAMNQRAGFLSIILSWFGYNPARCVQFQAAELVENGAAWGTHCRLFTKKFDKSEATYDISVTSPKFSCGKSYTYDLA